MALTFKSAFSGAGKFLKRAAPVIGGVIGGAVGGPGGAMVGSAIGGAVSGGSKPKVQSYDAIPSDVKGLRGKTADWLGNNMGGLTQTAAQSTPTYLTRTQDVAMPGIDGVSRAASGQDPNASGRYVGMQNFNPNQTTGNATYQGAGSVGNGQTSSIIQQLMGMPGGANQQAMSALLNGGGGVAAQGVRGLTEGQQSVSDLATGGFMDKMLSQYSPLFEQQRQQALAAAKESAGNLTGSGFANALGNSTAQTLAQQQAALGSLAQFGIGQELGRQQNLAGLQNKRNLADAGNSLQASMANASNSLQGAQSAGQLGLAGQDQRIRALAAGGDMELANLSREQGRLTSNAAGMNDMALQNRGITSNEQGRNMGLDLQRLTSMTGMQQNDAQAQAGRDQQTNLFNSQSQNDRSQFVTNLMATLGMNNRQLSSQENQFLASLLQQNQQFNAGQTNNTQDANGNRIASLLGGMTTAGVGVPPQTQSPGFLDSLIGGATAALPFFLNRPASGGARAGGASTGGGTMVNNPTSYGSMSQDYGAVAQMGQPTGNMGQPMGTRPMVDPSMGQGGGGWAGAPVGSRTNPGPVDPSYLFSGGAQGGDGAPVPGASGGVPLWMQMGGGGGGGWQAGDSRTSGPTGMGGGMGQYTRPMGDNMLAALGSGGPAGGGMGGGNGAWERMQQSQIAGAPQSQQGFMDAMQNMGSWGQTGGGLTNRAPSSFLNQLPMLRVGG